MHDNLASKLDPAPNTAAAAMAGLSNRESAPQLSIAQRVVDRVLSLFFRDIEPGMTADERERCQWDRVD